MAVTGWSQTGYLVEGYGNPLTLTEFKALSGTSGRFAFVASSNTAGDTAPRCDKWCRFTNVHNNTLDETALFYLKDGSAEGTYKVKRSSDDAYVITSTSATSFGVEGTDFKLVNRDPNDATMAVTGEQSISFEDPSNSGLHYNANAVIMNAGPGAWTTYAVFGPIYMNVTIQYLDEDDNEVQPTEVSAFRVGGEVEAPEILGHNIVGATTDIIDADDQVIIFRYEETTYDYDLVVNGAAVDGMTMTIKGEEITEGSSTYSSTSEVSTSDVVVTFGSPYDFLGYTYSVTIEGSVITVNCYVPAEEITDADDLTDGYYIIKGKVNGQNGYMYNDTSLANRQFRISTSNTIELEEGQYNENLKYVWYLATNGDGTFTLQNAQTLNFFPADADRNQNFSGTETANLVWDATAQNIAQTNHENASDGTLYVHCNQPGGDMNMSYWSSGSHPDAGVGEGSLVAPTFLKVQLGEGGYMAIFGSAMTDLQAVMQGIDNRVIGSELNQYSSAADEATIQNAVNDVNGMLMGITMALPDLQKIQDATATLQGYIDGMTLNMPAPGSYLRIKGGVSGNYISFSANDGERIPQQGAADETTIFYFAPDGTLINYANGKGITGTMYQAAIGETKEKITFSESSITQGQYCLTTDYSGAQTIMYDAGGGVNRSSSEMNNECAWTLEEVTELPLKLTDLTYLAASEFLDDYGTHVSTLYLPVAVEITGAKAYRVVKVDEAAEEAELNEVTTVGAETGVVLIGTAAEATATIVGTEKGNSLLTGTYEAIDNPGGLLVLSCIDEAVGFYTLGADAEVLVNKAYYEGTTPVKIKIGGLVDAINKVESNNASAATYDLSGRKVSNAQKGVFIVNGKKVVK